MSTRSGTALLASPLRPLQTTILILSMATVLCFAYVIIGWRGSSISMYLRDPAAVFEFTPLAGMISHFGVFSMIGCGSILLFASHRAGKDGPLLFWIGIFSLMIALDDFFMIHEDIAPRTLGIDESYVISLYGLFALAVFIGFRNALIGSAHSGLYAALALLGASVLVDAVFAFSEGQVVFEDSLKFVGLIVWSAYWVRRAQLATEAQKAPLSPVAPAPVTGTFAGG
jgi:hypothetical protein